MGPAKEELLEEKRTGWGCLVGDTWDIVPPSPDQGNHKNWWGEAGLDGLLGTFPHLCIATEAKADGVATKSDKFRDSPGQ